jgi:hypothetical protein
VLHLLVQVLLPGLALLLGALLSGHVIRPGRTGVAAKNTKLVGGLVLDGLNGELLLALIDMFVSKYVLGSSTMTDGVNLHAYLFLLLAFAKVHFE